MLLTKLRKRDFFRAIMGWDKFCKNDYPHTSVCRLSFFQFFIVFFSCDRTYALEVVEPKFPSFRDYCLKVHPKLCKIAPELYFDIKWKDPDSFTVFKVYFVKKSVKTETLYLKSGYTPSSWFFADGTIIYGDQKSRPTKWKLVFREEDPNRFEIVSEPIEMFPYETFEMENCWIE